MIPDELHKQIVADAFEFSALRVKVKDLLHYLRKLELPTDTEAGAMAKIIAEDLRRTLVRLDRNERKNGK